MKGFTLIELIVAMAILSILAAGIVPLSQVTYKRTREAELRRSLRIVRNAIDDYKEMADEGRSAWGPWRADTPRPSRFWWKGCRSRGPFPRR